MAISKNELTLTLEQVNEILELRLPEYVFYWLVSNGRRVKVGSCAGTLNKKGYIRIQINGNLFYAHRLVWLVTYGKFPEGVIDHIDGDPSNNRVENLRDVSHKVNNQNKPKYKRINVDLPSGVMAHYNRVGEIRGYRAYWYDMNSKECAVYHGIRKHHTLEAALAAAIARRNLEMTKLVSQGVAYTERHGIAT